MNSIEFAKRIKLHSLRMVNLGNSSHIGSIFSMADIIAVLYSKILNIYPKNPTSDKRDRFILSKGHAGAGIYASLAELGFFPIKTLDTHCQNGSLLCGHIYHKAVPGIELSTGSLGHGLSIGCGMAYYAKLKKMNHKIFVLMGDGECDEGSVWEAILFAAMHKLDNLVAIVDYNKLQSITTTKETLNLEPFLDKWISFNWAAIEIDGHNHEELYSTLSSLPFQPGKPSCIIAHTIKGKGVSFMENNNLYHYRPVKGDLYIQAKKELEGN